MVVFLALEAVGVKTGLTLQKPILYFRHLSSAPGLSSLPSSTASCSFLYVVVFVFTHSKATRRVSSALLVQALVYFYFLQGYTERAEKKRCPHAKKMC